MEARCGRCSTSARFLTVRYVTLRHVWIHDKSRVLRSARVRSVDHCCTDHTSPTLPSLKNKHAKYTSNYHYYLCASNCWQSRYCVYGDCLCVSVRLSVREKLTTCWSETDAACYMVHQKSDVMPQFNVRVKGGRSQLCLYHNKKTKWQKTKNMKPWSKFKDGPWNQFDRQLMDSASSHLHTG